MSIIVTGILASHACDTELTELFDIGWPNAAHRVIRNRTMTEWEAAGRPPAGRRPGEGDVVAKRGRTEVMRYSDAQPTSSTAGDIESMAMYAGMYVGHVARVAAAAAIVEGDRSWRSVRSVLACEHLEELRR